MFAEARDLLPDKDTVVTEGVLERAVYAKAVVKETFRMNPISVGIGRVLPEECVFSGYRVPAGVNIIIPSSRKDGWKIPNTTVET